MSNAEAEAPFNGGPGEGLDREALSHPGNSFIELWVGELDAPMIGRNLLGDKAFAQLVADLDGRHALLVVSTVVGAEAAPALLARFAAQAFFVGKDGKLWRTSGFAIAAV